MHAGHLSVSTRRLDEIVAAYAPIGRRQRAAQRWRQVLFVAGISLVIGVSAKLSQWSPGMRDGVPAYAGTDPHDVEAVSSRIAELEAQLARVESQTASVERQRAELETQNARLAALIDGLAADTAIQDRGQRPSPAAELEQEIAAMAEQRKALAERWAQFEKQGELLAMEIVAVNAQRKELEAQRQLIETQRREMQKLLDQATELYRRNVSAAGREVGPEPVDPPNDDFIATPNSLMVNATTLDEMRGGFAIGENMDISFGFEQTGYLNGEQQFRNSFNIDSMGSGLKDVDMSNMQTVILQNGTGNFVGDGVLESLADNFGSIIQNTLDDQIISTTTVYDISLHNVNGAMQGLAGERALLDTLSGF